MSCFCCLSEDAQVGKVLSKFAPQPVSQACNFMLQKLVGRVVPASNNQQPLYAPGSGKPCVYYKISVEECWQITEIDEETGERRSNESWEQILVDEQCRDFYLQDGMNKLFINGSNRAACKIQSEAEDSGGGWFSFKEPPPGVRALVGTRRPEFGFHTSVQADGDYELRRRTGEIRYTEKAFDVNEILACLGVPVPNTDPFTGQQIQVLQPFNEESLTDEFFESAGWSAYETKSWHSLLQNGAAVLLSDSTHFTDGVAVQPITNMQPWMIQPLTTQLLIAQPQMYAPVQPVILAPVQVTPVMPCTIVAPVIVSQPGVVQIVPSN
jgi:hypothetical protein